MIPPKNNVFEKPENFITVPLRNHTFLITCDVPPFRVFFGDLRLVSDTISEDTKSFFFFPNILFRLFDIPIFQIF